MAKVERLVLIPVTKYWARSTAGSSFVAWTVHAYGVGLTIDACRPQVAKRYSSRTPGLGFLQVTCREVR